MAEGQRRNKKSQIAVAESDPPELVEEETSDTRLVDAAVDKISEILSATLYKGVIDVGTYVLETFYGNDPDRVSKNHPQKKASLGALAQRCGTQELPLSKTQLHTAVWSAAMLRQLPADASAFRELPPSHQATLLPLRDPAKVEQFAKRALKKNSTVRELRDTVKEERAKSKDPDDQRGRPPTPTALKALKRALASCSSESNRTIFTVAAVKELSEEQATEAREAAETLLKRLTEFVERLGGSE